MQPERPKPKSLFQPVRTKTRNDASEFGFVLGVAVVLFGLVLLVVLGTAWFR